jgi:hypothetical protein
MDAFRPATNKSDGAAGDEGPYQADRGSGPTGRERQERGLSSDGQLAPSRLVDSSRESRRLVPCCN